MALQADGKVLVAGVATPPLVEPRSMLLRLNMDGSRDANFKTDTFSWGGPRFVAVQADGRDSDKR